MAENSQLGLVCHKDKRGENENNPLNLGIERLLEALREVI